MVTSKGDKHRAAVWETLRNIAHLIAVRPGDLTALAASFPSLEGVACFAPFDLRAAEAWLDATHLTANAIHAACFVLEVAGARSAYRFYPIEALKDWDGPHRAAFIAWAINPWSLAGKIG